MAQQRRDRRNRGEDNKRDFEQKVVEVKRVTRVVAGGKRMRFRALVVIGDKKGKVGIGLRKGTDVTEAVQKAVNAAKKTMVSVIIVNDSIPHEVKMKYIVFSRFPETRQTRNRSYRRRSYSISFGSSRSKERALKNDRLFQ